jgi:integrase
LDNTVIGELKAIASDKKNPYIFAKGNGHSKESQKRFAKALQRRGIKDYTLHTLRYTFASHSVMAGVDLATVRELMGHKSYKTTLRHAHLAPEHKREAILKLADWRKGAVKNRSKGLMK